MKYSEKLRDPRWQRRRLEVMRRDDFTCLCCGDKSSTLNVHHKQYHGDPWDAPMESLETLCEKCHEKRKALNQAMLMLPTRLANLWFQKLSVVGGKLLPIAKKHRTTWAIADGERK